MSVLHTDKKRLFNPRYPLLFAAIAAASVAMGTYLSLITLLFTCLILCVVIIVFMFFLKKQRVLLALCLFIVLLFSLYANIIDKQKFYTAPGSKIILSGCVGSTWQRTDSGYSAELDKVVVLDNGNKTRLKHRVILTLKGDEKPGFSYGDVIELQCRLYNIDPPQNPGQADFRRNYLAKNIAYSAYGEAGETQRLSHKGDIYGVFVHLRERICENIDQALTQRSAGIVKGMLLGEEQDIYPEIRNQFALLGIVHILSVSGLHVMIIVYALRWFLKAIKLSPKASFATVLVFLFCYGAITAFDPPVLRASFMAALLLYADCFGERYDSLNALGLSALVILLINPMQLFSLGFKLTYLSCLGIFLYANVVKTKIPVLKQLLSGALLTVSAQLGIIPILINVYGYVSVVSILANILLSWPSSLIIILSFFFSIISLIIPPAGLWLLSLLEGLVSVFMLIVELLDPLGKYMLRLSYFSLGAIALYYLLFILLSKIVLEKPHKKLIAAVVCVVVFFAGTFGFCLAFPRGVQITVLSVGSADCAIITTPSGKIYMVDTASTDYFSPYQNNSGESVLMPYLRYRRIKQIDGVFITHGDADHIGGLLPMYGNIGIKNIYYNPITINDQRILNLLGHYEALGTNLVPVWEDTALYLDEGLACRVLYPKKNSEYKNNISLALKFTVWGTDILFAGDNEEKDLSALMDSADISCHILFAPHHGSLATTHAELYAKAAPAYVLVSSNKEFTFDAKGAKIYNTASYGALTIVLKPEKSPKITGYRRAYN